MKKRLITVILCALLLVSLFPDEARGDGLNFIAVNDYLPPELINVIAYYGGVAYVPSWLFTNYGLGVYYSFFSSSSTAYLFNSNSQLFFELSTGKTYDSNDTQYAAPAIMWGGTVYLPLGFVNSYFGGFSYRVIGSNEYGSILRITTGSEVLTDEEFFRAAGAAMRRYYTAWVAETTTTSTAKPTATAKPTETPTPTPTEKPSREGDTVHLGLDGLPTEATLELLRRQRIRACFFLSSEEIRDNPDMVRRIACEGHVLGTSSSEGDVGASAEAAALLWETARVRTILTATQEGAVQPDGMVTFPSARSEAGEDAQAAAYSVTSQLELRAGDQTVIFPASSEDADAALSVVLRYLRELDFTVTTIRETDGGGTPIIPR